MGWEVTCKFCGQVAKHAYFTCNCSVKEAQRVKEIMKGATIIDFFGGASPSPIDYWHVRKDGKDFYLQECGSGQYMVPGWTEIDVDRYLNESQIRQWADKENEKWQLFQETVDDVLVTK